MWYKIVSNPEVPLFPISFNDFFGEIKSEAPEDSGDSDYFQGPI